MPDIPPAETFVPLLCLILSPAIGSFLNVVIDRLPRGESLLRPGSTCRNCQTRLRWYDLIPILSFVVSAGRCRHCAAAIPPWHLYVELAAVGLAGLAWAQGGTALETALIAVVLWLLLALLVCDLLWFRLPDGLVAALLLVALAQAAAVQAKILMPPGHVLLPHNLMEALVGGLLGSASFWLIRAAYRHLRKRQGLGLGDVKLMAGLGALVGPWLLPHLVLLAALIALVGAATQALCQKRRLAATRALPFGAALAVATALIWTGSQLAG